MSAPLIPLDFISSSSKVMRGRLTWPFNQGQKAPGLAETGGSRNSSSLNASGCRTGISGAGAPQEFSPANRQQPTVMPHNRAVEFMPHFCSPGISCRCRCGLGGMDGRRMQGIWIQKRFFYRRERRERRWVGDWGGFGRGDVGGSSWIPFAMRPFALGEGMACVCGKISRRDAEALRGGIRVLCTSASLRDQFPRGV